MSNTPSQGSQQDDESARRAFRQDVLAGLTQPQKRLPCKYFYDQQGCRLFEAICQLDEYYLTRTELAIMQQGAGEMATLLGTGCMVIEYGSGSSLKTRLLLDHLDRPAAYVPVDIACGPLQEAAAALERRYPELTVLPVCTDFASPFTLPECPRAVRRRVVYFPGSTIGNFEPEAARDLLQSIAGLCRPDGGLLIGIDLKKDPAILERAYNDCQGVTAAFNLNLLARINGELDADFRLDQFRHHAFYNRQAGRVEMQLVSLAKQQICVGGERLAIDEGETITTEYSHKYDLDQFQRWAASCGLQFQNAWTDSRNWFAVAYFRVP